MAPSPQRLRVTRQSWKLAQPFTISRGSKTVADVVVAEISDGDSRGRGECVPYTHYGETAESVFKTLEGMVSKVFSGLDRAELQTAMPPGAARNALDAAFWDIDAKRNYCPVTVLAKLPALQAVTTAYTLSDVPVDCSPNDPNFKFDCVAGSTANSQMTYETAPNLRTAYITQFAGGFDQQVTRTSSLSVNYLHSQGVHQLATQNIGGTTTLFAGVSQEN